MAAQGEKQQNAELQNGNSLDNSPDSTPQSSHDVLDNQSRETGGLSFAEELRQIEAQVESLPDPGARKYDDLPADPPQQLTDLVLPHHSLTDDNQNIQEEVDVNENISPLEANAPSELKKGLSEESDSVPHSSASCTESTSLDSQQQKTSENKSEEDLTPRQEVQQIIDPHNTEKKHTRAPSMSGGSFDKMESSEAQNCEEIERKPSLGEKSESLEVQPRSSRAPSLADDAPNSTPSQGENSANAVSDPCEANSEKQDAHEELSTNQQIASKEQADDCRRESTFSLSDLPLPDFAAEQTTTKTMNSSLASNAPSGSDSRRESDLENMGPEITFRKASSVTGESRRDSKVEPEPSEDGGALQTLLSSSAAIVECVALDDVVTEEGNAPEQADASPSALAQLLSSTALIAESVALPEKVAEAVAETIEADSEENCTQQSAISTLLSNTVRLTESVTVPQAVEEHRAKTEANDVTQAAQQIVAETCDAASNQVANILRENAPTAPASEETGNAVNGGEAAKRSPDSVAENVGVKNSPATEAEVQEDCDNNEETVASTNATEE